MTDKRTDGEALAAADSWPDVPPCGTCAECGAAPIEGNICVPCLDALLAAEPEALP